MRKRKQIGLRAMSTILAAVLLMAGMSTANLPIRDMSVSAKTLAELQDERQANEAKIAEKQKKLDSLQSNMNENEQYQKTLKEKITLQQENLDIVSEELKRIGTSISETEDAIAQAENDKDMRQWEPLNSMLLISSTLAFARYDDKRMWAYDVIENAMTRNLGYSFSEEYDESAEDNEDTNEVGGQPGLRPNYGPTYYAAFVHDPEGNNIEAMLA